MPRKVGKEKVTYIIPSKLMLTAIFITLFIVGTVSYAAPGKSQGGGGWELSADHVETVAISIKTDPLLDPEAACIALQIGMNLLMDSINVGGNSVPVKPADTVILFPSLGGVELVNPENETQFDKKICFTPAGPNSRSLNQLLTGFENLGGKILACPLCAAARGIKEPSRGDIADGVDIHNLFLYSDRVIDF